MYVPLGETFVHEGQVAFENGAEHGPVLLGDVQGAQAVEGRLVLRPVHLERGAPQLVRPRIRQVRGHDLVNGHGAVADRLGELVDDRHRGRDLGGVAGAIQDHLPALPVNSARMMGTRSRMFCLNFSSDSS